MYGGTNAVDINNCGHHTVEYFVQTTVVATHADEHTHLAQCQRLQTRIVGLAVTAKGYPNYRALRALKGIPSGVDTTGGGIVDELDSMDARHIFKTGLGFVKADETIAKGFVAHVSQTGGINGSEPAIYAVATLCC